MANRNFRALFEEYLPADLQKSMLLDSATFAATGGAIALNTALPALDREHSLQQTVRPWFRKTDINKTPIGPHPDFAVLAGSQKTEKHHITTLFLDIENSTRLSLLYDLELVARIKNAVLQAASEMVRALDGHVHRFMGDALMAFFGRKGQSPEDSAMAALNCAALLRLLMKESVLPELQKRGVEDIGFRIGIDYGSDEDVLWASYGFSEVNEVTAASFFVDVAAKLQQRAGRNQVMLGSSILEFIDIPEPFREIRVVERDGKTVSRPILLPNLTQSDGSPLNYKVRLLNEADFEALLPIPTATKHNLNIGNARAYSGISYELQAQGHDGEFEHCASLSRCLDRDLLLKFVVRVQIAGMQHTYPLKVEFVKTNYGRQAEAKGQAMRFQATTYTKIRPSVGSGYGSPVEPFWEIVHPEATSYRGIHTMQATVTDGSSRVLFRDIIGVQIR